MENPPLMGIMNSARQLDDELRRASIRYWLALDNFVEWSAFHELHAEVAGTVTFPDLVNRDDATGGPSSLRLPPQGETV